MTLLLNNGHVESEVQGYHYAKYRSYVEAARRRERMRTADLIEAVTIAARSKDPGEAAKKLRKDDGQ